MTNFKLSGSSVSLEPIFLTVSSCSKKYWSQM